MGTVAVEGVSMEYREEGSGDPVVLVHGGVSDLRSWEAQTSAFASQHRVVNYSRRYHWPNEPIPEGVPDPISVHVDDLVGLLESLELASAHLVGHSWGAYTCLLAALRRPDLVRSLVLEEPPVLSLLTSTPPRPTELVKLLVTNPGGALAFMRFGAGAVNPTIKAFKRGDRPAGARAFASGVTGRDYDTLSEARREQVDINAAPLEAELVRGGLEDITEAQVATVQAPALLVNGERSPPVFHRLNDILGKRLPNAARVTVPAASHWAHEDNPGQFNTAVFEFLSRH